MWLNELSFWPSSVCDPLPNWYILVMEDTSYIYILNLPRITCSGVASYTVEWAFLEQSLIRKMNYRIPTDDQIKVFSKKRFFPDHSSLHQQKPPNQPRQWPLVNVTNQYNTIKQYPFLFCLSLWLHININFTMWNIPTFKSPRVLKNSNILKL